MFLHLNIMFGKTWVQHFRGPRLFPQPVQPKSGPPDLEPLVHPRRAKLTYRSERRTARSEHSPGLSDSPEVSSTNKYGKNNILLMDFVRAKDNNILISHLRITTSTVWTDIPRGIKSFTASHFSTALLSRICGVNARTDVVSRECVVSAPSSWRLLRNQVSWGGGFPPLSTQTKRKFASPTLALV